MRSPPNSVLFFISLLFCFAQADKQMASDAENIGQFFEDWFDCETTFHEIVRGPVLSGEVDPMFFVSGATTSKRLYIASNTAGCFIDKTVPFLARVSITMDLQWLRYFTPTMFAGIKGLVVPIAGGYSTTAEYLSSTRILAMVSSTGSEYHHQVFSFRIADGAFMWRVPFLTSGFAFPEGEGRVAAKEIGGVQVELFWSGISASNHKIFRLYVDESTTPKTAAVKQIEPVASSSAGRGFHHFGLIQTHLVAGGSFQRNNLEIPAILMFDSDTMAYQDGKFFFADNGKEGKVDSMATMNLAVSPYVFAVVAQREADFTIKSSSSFYLIRCSALNSNVLEAHLFEISATGANIIPVYISYASSYVQIIGKKTTGTDAETVDSTSDWMCLESEVLFGSTSGVAAPSDQSTDFMFEHCNTAGVNCQWNHKLIAHSHFAGSSFILGMNNNYNSSSSSTMGSSYGHLMVYKTGSTGDKVMNLMSSGGTPLIKGSDLTSETSAVTQTPSVTDRSASVEEVYELQTAQIGGDPKWNQLTQGGIFKVYPTGYPPGVQFVVPERDETVAYGPGVQEFWIQFTDGRTSNMIYVTELTSTQISDLGLTSGVTYYQYDLNMIDYFRKSTFELHVVYNGLITGSSITQATSTIESDLIYQVTIQAYEGCEDAIESLLDLKSGQEHFDYVLDTNGAFEKYSFLPTPGIQTKVKAVDYLLFAESDKNDCVLKFTKIYTTCKTTEYTGQQFSLDGSFSTDAYLHLDYTPRAPSEEVYLGYTFAFTNGSAISTTEYCSEKIAIREVDCSQSTVATTYFQGITSVGGIVSWFMLSSTLNPEKAADDSCYPTLTVRNPEGAFANGLFLTNDDKQVSYDSSTSGEYWSEIEAKFPHSGPTITIDIRILIGVSGAAVSLDVMSESQYPKIYMNQGVQTLQRSTFDFLITSKNEVPVQQFGVFEDTWAMDSSVLFSDMLIEMDQARGIISINTDASYLKTASNRRIIFSISLKMIHDSNQYSIEMTVLALCGYHDLTISWKPASPELISVGTDEEMDITSEINYQQSHAECPETDVLAFSDSGFSTEVAFGQAIGCFTLSKARASETEAYTIKLTTRGSCGGKQLFYFRYVLGVSNENIDLTTPFTLCTRSLTELQSLHIQLQKDEGMKFVVIYDGGLFLKLEDNCASNSPEVTAEVQDMAGAVVDLLPVDISTLSLVMIDTSDYPGSTNQYQLFTTLKPGSYPIVNTFRITVCGSFSLPSDPVTLELTVTLNDVRKWVSFSESYKPAFATLSEEFSFCSFAELFISTDASGTKPDSSSLLSTALKVDESSGVSVLVSSFSATQNLTYFIAAKNQFGNMSYQPVTLVVVKETNTMPRFDGDLTSSFGIQLDSSGSPNISTIEYNSPKIVDDDDEPFTVELEFDGQLRQFMTISYEEAESRIEMAIDANRINPETHVGNFTIEISIIDQQQPGIPNIHKITLRIIKATDDKEDEPVTDKSTTSSEEEGQPSTSPSGEDATGQDESDLLDLTSVDLTNPSVQEARIDPSQLASEQVSSMLSSIEGFSELEPESKETISSTVSGIYPGISIAQLFATLRRIIAYRLLRESELQPIKKERASVTSIEGSSFSLIFTEPLVVPGDTHNIDYSKMFSVSLVSAITKSSTIGSQEGEIQVVPRRRLQALSDESEDDDQIENSEPEFRWSIAKHTPTEIQIQIDFDAPELISATVYGRDEVVFELLTFKPFIFQETGDQLEQDDFAIELAAHLPRFTLPLPPQIDPEVKQMISNSTETIGTMVNSVSVGNFILAMLTSGSMQQLWGLIRAVQLMVLTALMEITFPANAAEFYKRAILFATMDVLSGEKLYSKIFEFRDTLPLSAKFEEMDFGDLNFIMNSGSFFILFLLILVEPLCRKFLSWICLCFSRYKVIRSLGVLIHRKSHLRLAKEGSFRLFLESYFELCMCSALNLVAFLATSSDSAEIKLNFSTRDDSINSSMALIGVASVFIFPIWAIVKIRRVLEDQRRPPSHLGFLLEEFQSENQPQALYQVFFMLRRFALVAILVFMRHQVFFQCMLVSHLSLLNFIYISVHQPFKHESTNKIEAFNEFTVLLSSMIINSFLNAGVDLEFREFSGWLLVGVACLNIGSNLVIVGASTLSELRLQLFTSFSDHCFHRNQEDRFTRWETFQKAYPFIGKDNFLHIKQEYQLRKFCQSWSPQRKWLLFHGLDLQKFPEEEKFQEAMAFFKFREQAATSQQIQNQIAISNRLKAKREHHQLTQSSIAQAIQFLPMKSRTRNRLLSKLPAIEEEDNEAQGHELHEVKTHRRFVSEQPVLSQLQKLVLKNMQEHPSRGDDARTDLNADLRFALSSSSSGSSRGNDVESHAAQLFSELAERNREQVTLKTRPKFIKGGGLNSLVSILFEIPAITELLRFSFKSRESQSDSDSEPRKQQQSSDVATSLVAKELFQIFNQASVQPDPTETLQTDHSRPQKQQEVDLQGLRKFFKSAKYPPQHLFKELIASFRSKAIEKLFKVKAKWLCSNCGQKTKSKGCFLEMPQKSGRSLEEAIAAPRACLSCGELSAELQIRKVPAILCVYFPPEKSTEVPDRSKRRGRFELSKRLKFQEKELRFSGGIIAESQDPLFYTGAAWAEGSKVIDDLRAWQLGARCVLAFYS